MSCGIVFALEGDAGAAFGRQELNGPAHLFEINTVQNLAPPPGLENQPGLDKRAQVMRQGRGGQSEMLADLTHGQTVLAGLHQQTVNTKARVMPEGGEGPCGGCRNAHTFLYNRFSSYVNAMAIDKTRPRQPTADTHRHDAAFFPCQKTDTDRQDPCNAGEALRRCPALLRHTEAAGGYRPSRSTHPSFTSDTRTDVYRILKGLIYLALGALLLAVAAAAVVPHFIDWSDYKAEIEARATAITGHDVRIAGDIDLRLLPAPSLRAEKVTVSGAKGTPALAEIGRLDMELRLLPLFAGRVEATSVLLVAPKVRLADGNWKSTRSRAEGNTGLVVETGGEGGSAGSGLSFRLDNIQVQSGEIRIDRAGKHPPFVADRIDMRLSAETLAGPFKGMGTAAPGGLGLVRVEFSVGPGETDGAMPLTVTLIPADGPSGTGRVWIKGIVSNPGDDPRFAGKLRIEGQSVRAPAGLILAGLGLPMPPKALAGPMTGEATLTASGTGARIAGLALDLDGTSIRGDIDMTFAGPTRPRSLTKAVVRVNRVDLDAVMQAYEGVAPAAGGGGSSGGSGSGDASGGAGTGNGHGYHGIELPDGTDIDLTIAIDAVVLNRSVIRGTEARASLRDGRLAVEKLTALLPGAARVEVAGAFHEARGFTRFDGTVNAEAGNLRGTLDWLAVDVAGVPADRLRQSSLKARLSAGSDAIRLSEMMVNVDLARFEGAAAVDFLPRPRVTLVIETAALDLDAYLPRALPKTGEEAKPALKPASQGEEGANPEAIDWETLWQAVDLDFKLDARAVSWRERPHGPLALRFERREKSQTLHQFVLADLGGATVEISGALRHGAGGAHVDIEGRAKVSDTARLLRFLGKDAGAVSGPLSGKLRLTQGKQDGDWSLNVTVEDANGVGSLTGTGRLDEKDGRRKLTADLAASEISGPVLAALVAGAAAPPPDIVTPAAGTSGVTSGAGSGSAGAASGWPATPFDLTALHLFDLAVSLKASALDLGTVRIEAPRARIALSEGLLAVTNFSGEAYGGTIEGELTLDARAIPKLAIRIDADDADLTRFVGGISLKDKEIVGLAAGKAGLEVELSGEGASPRTLVSSLTGEVVLEANDGELRGFDLQAANAGIRERAGGVGILGLLSGAMTRGSTKFETLRLAGVFKDGRLTFTKGVLDADGGDGETRGMVDLAAGTLDVVSAFRFDAIPKAPPLEMKISGKLDAPRTFIDVQALTAWLRANP